MKKSNLAVLILAVATYFCSCDRPVDPVDNEGGISLGDTTEIVDPEPIEPQDNIYQFTVLDGNGDSVSLSDYRGKVLLVVNTATQCGYTPQYTDLQNLYDRYKDQGFVVLDFPCNQFGNQAPGSYDDIHDFCTGNYHITFPQFAKIAVKGPNAIPLYVWLKSKKPGEISWNFTKFLIDKNGEVVSRYEPNTSMVFVENGIKAQLNK